MHFNKKRIIFPTIKVQPTFSSKKKNDKKLNKKDINVVPRIEKEKTKKVKIVKNDTNLLKEKIMVGEYKPIEGWNNLLSGFPAFLLGNGPSLSGQDLSILEGYFTIGINRIFFIYDPTILIWQDRQIWQEHKTSVLKQKSLKVCTDISDPRQLFFHYKRLHNPYRFTMNPSILAGSGNTGVLSAQLAVALGCNSLILLGMDCKYEKGGKTDFYGKNKDHRGHTLKMCNNAMMWLKEKCPVPVYNCSNNDFWPKRNIRDVINEITPPIKNRDFYLGIFKK